MLPQRSGAAGWRGPGLFLSPPGQAGAEARVAHAHGNFLSQRGKMEAGAEPPLGFHNTTAQQKWSREAAAEPLNRPGGGSRALPARRRAVLPAAAAAAMEEEEENRPQAVPSEALEPPGPAACPPVSALGRRAAPPGGAGSVKHAPAPPARRCRPAASARLCPPPTPPHAQRWPRGAPTAAGLPDCSWVRPDTSPARRGSWGQGAVAAPARPARAGRVPRYGGGASRAVGLSVCARGQGGLRRLWRQRAQGRPTSPCARPTGTANNRLATKCL